MPENTNAPAEEKVTEQPVEAAAEAAPEAKPSSKEPERDDMTTLHERTIAVLSYFGFFAIIPFYLKKDSEFCRFHGKQGMLLAVFFFMAKLFTVIDLVMDLMLILQVILLFIMGFAALSGRWRKIPFGYNWSCQLEEALTLMTKDEEEAQVGLKPNEVREGEEATEDTADKKTT